MVENTFLTGYYNKARLAACVFLNNKLGCGIRIENVMLPVKRLTAKNDRACRPTDLCCRMTSDYPVRSAAEISTAEKTDAVFDFGNDGDTIFQGFYFDNGYANFLVSDEFILDAAKEFHNNFPIGRVCNNISLPDSREYVHARLICYRKANRYADVTRFQHSAAILALAAIDEIDPERRKRLVSAVCRVLLAAFAEGKGIEPDIAGFLAAFLNCY